MSRLDIRLYFMYSYPIMAKMVEITCKCGCNRKKMVRLSDVNRGWGKFYSKSCKARWQERRTHQFRDYHQRQEAREYEQEYGGTACFDNQGRYIGFSSHFSNEEHDCNKD